MVLSGSYLLADIVGERVVIRAGPGILLQQSVKIGVAQNHHLRFSLSGLSGSIREASIQAKERRCKLPIDSTTGVYSILSSGPKRHIYVRTR